MVKSLNQAKMEKLLQLTPQAQLFGAFLVGNLTQTVFGLSNLHITTTLKQGKVAARFLQTFIAFVITIVTYIVLNILSNVTNTVFIVLLEIMTFAFVLHFIHYIMLFQKNVKYLAFLSTTAIMGGAIYYLKLF